MSRLNRELAANAGDRRHDFGPHPIHPDLQQCRRGGCLWVWEPTVRSTEPIGCQGDDVA